jgi:glycosyltransferase involved in cell wall biosynthesis
MHRDSLIEMVFDLGLGDRVAFPGYIPSDDLPVLLNSVDAFIMPSAAELQSIATLEAMSCGRPILAANARALPELVEHGVNGYLFSPHNEVNLHDTIRHFLARRSRWPDMGEASLEKAQPHQLQRTIVRYVEWYESVCRRTINQNSHLRSQTIPAKEA